MQQSYAQASTFILYFQLRKRKNAAILNDPGANINVIIAQRPWKLERQYIELNCNEVTNDPQH